LLALKEVEEEVLSYKFMSHNPLRPEKSSEEPSDIEGNLTDGRSYRRIRHQNLRRRCSEDEGRRRERKRLTITIITGFLKIIGEAKIETVEASGVEIPEVEVRGGGVPGREVAKRGGAAAAAWGPEDGVALEGHPLEAEVFGLEV